MVDEGVAGGEELGGEEVGDGNWGSDLMRGQVRPKLILGQVMASPFFGGPERQVFGLGLALRPDVETAFYTYGEGGKAYDFLHRVGDGPERFTTRLLQENWPRVLRCVMELRRRFRQDGVDVVCTNGYKPDVLGLLAAGSMGLPVVSIAHGWTSATRKVRVNEWLDKRAMRWFDRVVGVSECQSTRCVAAGVGERRVVTIANGIDPDQMGRRDEAKRLELKGLFEGVLPRTVFVAAGRLSPEKGFDVLIDAAKGWDASQMGLVIFGGGPLEGELREQIGGSKAVVLGGFRDDLDEMMPQADGFVLSSRTEGLPVVLLECMAAGVPPVVTPVGGVPEVVRDGVEGLHVPVEDAAAIDAACRRLADDEEVRRGFGEAAEKRIRERYTHRRQADEFRALFDELVPGWR